MSGVIVYTTIFGGSDSLKPAPKGVDAVCYVDWNEPYTLDKRWTLKPCHIEGDPRRTAWHLRCIPHELFPDADRTIWIDASFTLTNVDRLLKDAGDAEIAALRHHRRSTCYEEGAEVVATGQAELSDVRAQLNGYRRVGFEPTHLSISCILVRANTPAVRNFNLTWDQEINRHPGDNTQLSLDYAAWKQGLTIKALKGSRHDNPYAQHDAKDHKRRRKPYQKAVTA